MAKKNINIRQIETQNTNNNSVPEEKEKSKFVMPKNRLVLVLKMLVVAVVIIGFVRWTDSKRWFQTRESKSQYKSDCVDKLLEDRKMDIVFVGNSHAETIDPFVIAQSFKCNTCVYSEPGILSDGLYYLVENFLEKHTPKLLCIETYCFLHDSYIKKEKRDAAKSRVLDRIDSETRKIKFLSENFDFDKSLLYYSKSLRNHEILFDTLLLNQGLKREENKGIDTVSGFNDEKYRFAKFGAFFFYATLSDSVVSVSDSIGPLVDGNAFEYEVKTCYNIDRIVKLCNEKKVPVLFYTAPIYYKVFANYDSIHSKLDSIISKFNVKWADFQQNCDTMFFGRNAYYDNYEVNMHLNRYSMKYLSYLLANYINDTLNISFPDRSNSKKWQSDFLGTFDYQYISDVLKNDTVNKVVLRNVEKDGVVIKEMFYNKKEKNDVVYAKVKKQGVDSLLNIAMKGNVNWYDKNINKQLTLTLKCKLNGKEMIGVLPLSLVQDIRPVHHYLFSAGVIKGLEIKEVQKIEIK